MLGSEDVGRRERGVASVGRGWHGWDWKRMNGLLGDARTKQEYIFIPSPSIHHTIHSFNLLITDQTLFKVPRTLNFPRKHCLIETTRKPTPNCPNEDPMSNATIKQTMQNFPERIYAMDSKHFWNVYKQAIMLQHIYVPLHKMI